MKVVALIPFRNEARCLPTCLASLRGIADLVIGYDDGSTDNSAALFTQYGGHCLHGEARRGSWGSGGQSVIRHALLAAGRKAGGTHFVWIDADEAFTANFTITARQRMEVLPPGHKLALQWLALWKTQNAYRDDASVWSNNFKDFIVCDDPALVYDTGFNHLGRTQGPNTDGNWHRVPLAEGAMLHFQFMDWWFFQIKQCWKRCMELVNGFEAAAINDKYAITLDDPTARLSPVCATWVADLPLPPRESVANPWQLGEIFDFFDQYGVEHFEPLQIWHMPELREVFVQHVGREPRIFEKRQSRVLACLKSWGRRLHARLAVG